MMPGQAKAWSFSSAAGLVLVVLCFWFPGCRNTPPPVLRNWEERWNMAKFWYNRAEYLRAVKMCLRVLEERPEFAEAYCLVGYCNLRLARRRLAGGQQVGAEGHYKAAIRFFRRAQQLKTPYGRAWVGIAEVNHDCGDFDKAVQACQLALRESEGDEAVMADAHYIMGRSLVYLGRFAEAQQQLRKYLELYPDAPNRKLVILVIDVLEAGKRPSLPAVESGEVRRW